MTDETTTPTMPEPQAQLTPQSTPEPSDRRPLIFGLVGAGVGLGLGLVLGAVVIPIIGGTTAAITAAVAPSPILTAVDACDVADNPWIRVGDNGMSLSMDSLGEESDGADFTDVFCVLEELKVTDSVLSRMEGTRALDGRLEGSWGDFEASWSYHPDNGLDVVVELVRD